MKKKLTNELKKIYLKRIGKFQHIIQMNYVKYWKTYDRMNAFLRFGSEKKTNLAITVKYDFIGCFSIHFLQSNEFIGCISHKFERKLHRIINNHDENKVKNFYRNSCFVDNSFFDSLFTFFFFHRGHISSNFLVMGFVISLQNYTLSLSL